LVPKYQTARYRGVAAQRTALAFDEAHEPLHHGPHAAHRKMHAPFAFEKRDQAEDRTGRERIATDEQRMETQKLAQLRILDVLRDKAVDRAVAFEPQQCRRDLDHVEERAEGLVDELFEADLENVLARFDEALEPGDVGRIEFCDLRAHAVGVARIVEAFAVLEADLIERINRAQRQIVRHLAPAQGPELLKHMRGRDDGGAGIEGKAVLAEDGSAPTGLFELLEHGHPVAARPQPDRGREPAEAAADHDRMRSRIEIARTGLRLAYECHGHLPFPPGE